MSNLTMHEAISFLEDRVVNSKIGLPEELFFFISRMTPMVNVDLLIKDESGRVLLAWREDERAGAGWHLPGGILRFKETAATRLLKVAETEIGAIVKFNPMPITINEIICEHDTRGHFISILYQGFLSQEFVPENRGLGVRDSGYLEWHNSCPEAMLKVQEIYKKYIIG